MTEQNKTEHAAQSACVGPQSPQERVRRLNDELRQRKALEGRIVVTTGIQAGGPGFVAQVLDAVAAFDAFDEDNDPWQEHDFGALDVQGKRVFFKVDYFDKELVGHSPDKSDPAVTTRVLTIMLASEY